jgi:hypothetical protein
MQNHDEDAEHIKFVFVYAHTPLSLRNTPILLAINQWIIVSFFVRILELSKNYGTIQYGSVNDYTPSCCYFPRRYVLVILCFFCLLIIYLYRVILSVAILPIAEVRCRQSDYPLTHTHTHTYTYSAICLSDMCILVFEWIEYSNTSGMIPREA